MQAPALTGTALLYPQELPACLVCDCATSVLCHLPPTKAHQTHTHANKQVAVKGRAVAKLMGRVFIEQAALNLLGSVLDTPGGWLGGACFALGWLFTPLRWVGLQPPCVCVGQGQSLLH